MTFIVLHADHLATALVDDPIVPAAEVQALDGAIRLFAQAGQIQADAARLAQEARDRSHAEGFAAGHAAGVAAGAEEVRAELFRLAMRDSEERRERQQQISTLALEVVRHIVGEIGTEAAIIGLAERATAALAPDTAAMLRVPPEQAAAVKARLADHAYLTVEADQTLSGTDCVIETALGRDYAALETQLAQIEAAWKDVGR